MMKTYNFHIAIGDIIAVGDAPARGTLLCRTMPMFVLSPNPAAGTQAVADTTRSMTDDCSLEIMTATGGAVGTIYYSGLYGGPPPPGAPALSTRSNMIVTGGTGAFFGVRGQAGQISWTPRVASVTADPSRRRVNGGGTQSVILQILPFYRPTVVSTSNGPAIVHSSDFTLVTSAKPAKAGEFLTLFASGLGPTDPSVEFGQPFPLGNPLVSVPVSVIINGNPVQASYAGGYSGAVDAYQVNFQMPTGVTGNALLRLTAGFIGGDPVSIPVQ
jgi:uncharacterized protein (TIGR03437 family)